MPDYRALVEALPASYDTAVDDAMANVTEQGMTEDTNPEVFWQAVHAEATAA